MKHLQIAALAAALGLTNAPGASAQTTNPMPPGPWADAQRLQSQELAKVRTGGILAIAPDVSAIEGAVAAAPRTSSVESGGQVVVLVDGSAQSLAATNGPWAGRPVSVVADPYPLLSLILGSYYNEVGRSADALRALDAGLALPSETAPVPGQIKPNLTIERGAALVGLHDWPRALADYEAGLALPALSKASTRGCCGDAALP